MVSKISIYITAVVGIAAASGAAWWYQSKPKGPTEITAKADGSPGAASGSVATAPAAGAAPPPAGGPGAVGPAGASGGPSRPAGVEVAKVERARLQDDAQSVGSLKSRQSVMLRPEVPGRVKEIGFTDGQRVRKGQKLVQLDDILQRAEIKQSTAQVSIATANHKRNQELVAQNFIAQRVLDESGAALQVAEAQLALSCARLSRMAILAPFDGTVGLRNVNIGDFVKDGADLINLEDIGSMFVDFRLPERFQGKLKLQQPVEVTLDAFPGRSFKARIEALDPLLDANGRSVGVRAVLPNTMGEPARDTGGRGSGGPGGPGTGAGSGGAGGAGGQVGQAAVGAGRPAGVAGAPGTSGAGHVAARPASAGAAAAGGSVMAAGPRPGGGAAASANGGRPGGGRPGAVAAPGAILGSGTTTAATQAPSKDADGCPIEPQAQIASAGAVRNAPGAPNVGAGQGAGAGRPAGATAGNPMPLRPGMFARVNTVFSINEAALMVPEEAIVPQGGRQFVVKVVPPEDVASVDKSKLPEGVKFVSLRQEVRLGVRRGGKVELLSGLEEGQTIVVAGQQRLQRDGSPLRVLEIGGRPGAPGSPGGAPPIPGATPSAAPGTQAGSAVPVPSGINAAAPGAPAVPTAAPVAAPANSASR